MADALGGIVAVLQTMQDQQKSANDAAAAKAEARIANAEAAIKTVATHIGDRFERYEKEAAARHARQSEQMRGQMRDEMRNKVGDAAEQVDQRDDAIRTLAKSVETTALRGAASDTAIRRIAETVQALDNSLHATREQAAETVVAVERLAAKNATPAEDVVAQIFMDPRLQTMIRAVVREAIEEIVMSDEADEDDAIDIPANDADAAPDKAKTAFPAQGQDVFMGWSGLVTSRPLRVGSILTERDVHRAKGEAKGIYLTDLSDVVGKQTRIALYKGRPLRPEDLGSPTVVRRNQIVTITFQRGGLSLRAEGRALDKGALGERIRVLNIDSRRTVFATITGPAAAKAQ